MVVETSISMVLDYNMVQTLLAMRHVTSSVPLGLEQAWRLFDIQMEMENAFFQLDC